MPEDLNTEIAETHGAELNQEAARLFGRGTDSRRQADEYIRTTVVLATILFLLVLSQRFRIRRARLGVLVVAIGLLAYGLIAIASFPRL